MPSIERSPRRAARSRLFATLYNQLASQYDRISAVAFAGEWSHWQAVAARLIDREPVVELGCGTGRLLAHLRSDGLDAFGIDLSRPMLRRARTRCSPDWLIQASASALPLGSASVGTMLSLFPTTYIYKPAVWAEVSRALAPGGRLIVIDHGWLTATDPTRFALRLLHWLVYGGMSPGGEQPVLPSAWPVTTLIERSPHGFASVMVATKPARAF